MPSDDANIRLWSLSCRRLGFVLIFAFLLGGCASGPQALDPTPGLDMAATRSSAYDAARENFAEAIILGRVTGTSGFLLGNADAEFPDGLKESLYINGLLAKDSASALYRIDLETNFVSSGVLEKHVDATIHYRVIVLSSNDLILDKTIKSNDTQTSELYDNTAAALATAVLTGRTDVPEKSSNARLSASRKNIEMFLAELSRWEPPAPEDPAVR